MKKRKRYTVDRRRKALKNCNNEDEIKALREDVQSVQRVLQKMNENLEVSEIVVETCEMYDFYKNLAMCIVIMVVIHNVCNLLKDIAIAICYS